MLRDHIGFYNPAKLPTGTPVYDVADERHVGRLEGVSDGKAIVKFPNGLKRDDIDAGDIRRAD